MEFSRQGYWSGLPFPSLGDLPDPEIKPVSPTLQADTLPSEPPLSQVRKSKTHVFTNEVGLKLQFSQMKQVRLTWLDGLITIFLEEATFKYLGHANFLIILPFINLNRLTYYLRLSS